MEARHYAPGTESFTSEDTYMGTKEEFIKGTRNTYTGYAKNGLEIEMYIDANGKIISAFPKE